MPNRFMQKPRKIRFVSMSLHPGPCSVRCNHRDTYLEQQQTEKIETEVRDVDKRWIRKVYACCPGWHSGGHKSAPVRHKHMLSAFRSAGPQLVFTFNNRFFRHQARYSLLPARPRKKPERQNVSGVYKEIMSLVATQSTNQSLSRNPFSRSECLIRFPCVG